MAERLFLEGQTGQYLSNPKFSPNAKTKVADVTIHAKGWQTKGKEAGSKFFSASRLKSWRLELAGALHLRKA